MAEQLVIYGNGRMVEVAYARFRRNPCYEIVGFTVDRLHLRARSMFGLRVVPFEDVEGEFPAQSVRLFISVVLDACIRRVMSSRSGGSMAVRRRGE